MSEEEPRRTRPEDEKKAEDSRKVKPDDLAHYSKYTSRDLKAKRARLSRMLEELDEQD